MLLVGQVAASPLLMCIEMSQISPQPDCHTAVMADSGMGHRMDAHGGQHMDGPNSLDSNHGSSHGDSPLCELCASCSSATGTHSSTAQSLLSFSPNEAGYNSDLIHILRTNPFRPPITA